jgi:hypothetical protein
LPDYRWAVRTRQVRETGRPTAQVARDLRINEETLGNWVMLTGAVGTAVTVR